MISLPKIPYIHRIYMVLANPIYMHTQPSSQTFSLVAYSVNSVYLLWLASQQVYSTIKIDLLTKHQGCEGQ